jgi:hypothetical protein
VDQPLHPYPYGFNRVRESPAPSPPVSVLSAPTRGWASPTASIQSAPMGSFKSPRGVQRVNLCFLCYKPGHLLSECPQLPGDIRVMAARNRAAYFRVAGRPNPAGPPPRGGHPATPLVAPAPHPGSVSSTEEVHMVVTAASAAGDPDPGIEDPIAPLEVMKETKNPEGGN